MIAGEPVQLERLEALTLQEKFAQGGVRAAAGRSTRS